mgnify:CR=1 FL=1
MDVSKWRDLENIFSNDVLPDEEGWKNNSVHIMSQMTYPDSDIAKAIVISNLKWTNLIVDQFAFDDNYKPTNLRIDLPFPKTLFDLICMDAGLSEALRTLTKWGQKSCVEAVSNAYASTLQELEHFATHDRFAIAENHLLTSADEEIALLSSIDVSDVSIARHFSQQGFAVLKDVFSEKEITGFRAAAIKKFPDNPPPFSAQFSSEMCWNEPFNRIYTNEKVVCALKEILGEDFIYLNEHGIQDSYRSGWHTDTETLELKGSHHFHWSPTFSVVQCVLYFQSNEEGGFGLDVIPRSHLVDYQTFDGLRPPVILGKAYDKVKPIKYGDLIRNQTGKMEPLRLDTKAGDIAFFHVRLAHRASPIKAPANNNSERKFGSFAIAGANNHLSRRYRSWLDEYDIMNGVSRTKIPESYQHQLSSIGIDII